MSTSRLANWIYERCQEAPQFQILHPSAQLFSFRYHPQGVYDEATLDALNAELVRRINDDGRIYLTQNRVQGRFAIRFQVGQTWTRRRHVEEGGR